MAANHKAFTVANAVGGACRGRWVVKSALNAKCSAVELLDERISVRHSWHVLWSPSSDRDEVRMENGACGILEREGVTALSYMEQALELLDQCEGTLDVGAHLDLAICRLRDVLGRSTIDPGERQWPTS